MEKVSGGNKCMTVHEVRAYELPNLLNKPGVLLLELEKLRAKLLRIIQ